MSKEDATYGQNAIGEVRDIPSVQNGSDLLTESIANSSALHLIIGKADMAGDVTRSGVFSDYYCFGVASLLGFAGRRE
ncbi:hypothetical protein ACFL6S_33740 [Candidatus Poribacteria bacterium]